MPRPSARLPFSCFTHNIFWVRYVEVLESTTLQAKMELLNAFTTGKPLFFSQIYLNLV